MATFSYNGVTLPYANVTDFRQEALYDDEGQVDVYLYKYDISVDCVLSPTLVTQMLAAGLVESSLFNSPALLLRALRKRLLTPRRQLSLLFDSVDLIPQAQQGNAGTVDAANGPKPQSCELIQLSDTTFLMRYRIIAHYYETLSDPNQPVDAQNSIGNPTLYNRWSETVDIDQNQFTTYTREGKFVIRSDNELGDHIDRFRHKMAVVGQRRGFLRTRSHYTVSPDGLALKYRVEDKEYFKPPPFGMTKADGWYEESTTKGGATRYGTAFVKLEGPKDFGQHRLLRAAIFIALKKLRDNGGEGPGAEAARGGDARRIVLQMGYVRLGLYENWVEVQLKAFMRGPRNLVHGIPIADGQRIMTHTPLSDDDPDNIGFPGQVRGTAGILMEAASYYDPALRNVNPRLLGDNIGPEPAAPIRGPVNLPGFRPGQLGTNAEP